MSQLAEVVIDTSVIIEYIDLKGELHEQAETIFSTLLTSRLEAIVPHPILAETYYVATRLYDRFRVEDPEDFASRLVTWLYRLPTVTIPKGDPDLAIEAGRAKLNYDLALTDCYVLAASKIQRCKALFKKREKEISRSVDLLKREYQILFLEDYK